MIFYDSAGLAEQCFTAVVLSLALRKFSFGFEVKNWRAGQHRCRGATKGGSVSKKGPRVLLVGGASGHANKRKLLGFNDCIFGAVKAMVSIAT